MRKPPSEHDEWLEENSNPGKKAAPLRKLTKQSAPNGPTEAEKRLKALNDDIHEFG